MLLARLDEISPSLLANSIGRTNAHWYILAVMVLI